MERVVTPRDDRSVISTFHAPSRAARRRWREANVMSDSCASVVGEAEPDATSDIPACFHLLAFYTQLFFS